MVAGGWRRWPLASLVLLVVALFAAGCGGSVPSQAGTEGGTADDVIKIGGVGPLSQPGAVQAGTEMKWAMEQAVADINAAGGVLGKRVELVFADTQNQPDVAAAAAEKLVHEDKVVGVVGGYHSAAALAQIPVYTKAGIPVIFSETWNDKITAGDPADPNLPPFPPTVFRIAPTSSYASALRADWIVKGLGAEKVVNVYEATDFGLGQNEALKKLLGEAGVEVVGIQVELNQADYTPALARVAQEHDDADVAVIDVTGESSYVVTQNAFDAGLIDEDTICLTNQQAQVSGAFWRAVPDGVGCVFSFVGPPPSQWNDKARSLAERFKAQFGDTPKAWVFEAYDSVWLLADAINRAGTTDGKAVVNALEKTSFTGTQGQYQFPYGSGNPVPKGSPPWMWHQWLEPPLLLIQYTERNQDLKDAAIVWPENRQTHGRAYVPVTH